MKGARRCLSGRAAMTEHTETSAPNLLADFRLLLCLFIVFRLTLALVYQPYTFDLYQDDGTPRTVQRGLSTFGDFQYFYQLAQLSDDGDLPYRDYWYEFPPVWSALFIGLYRVMSLRGAVDYAVWATALGLLLLAVDVGNLILLRCLARRLHGESAAMALSWVYALLASPVVFPWWNFEPLVVFWLLLALWLLLEDYTDRSALATVFGILTKFLGVLLLPAIWRFRDRMVALRYTVISLGLAAVTLGGVWLWGGSLGRASLVAQAHKPSYQTVWALIDGNRETGRFAPPNARFDADTAYERMGNAPVIPAWLRLLPFAAVGGVVFVQTSRRDDLGLLAFVTVTVVLFFLWSQGWSPQWALTLTPLVLLNYPDRAGVLLVIVLGFVSFVEYPVLFSRTGEIGGAITDAQYPLFVLLILVRTGLLIGLTAALIGRLRGEGARETA